jgi:hypothetical protein
MLFIDSRHTAEHLWGELLRHAPQVRRWIVLHDTVIFGETGEDGGPGLLPAVRRYLRDHPEWTVKSHARNNHGLMVLTREPMEKKELPALWKQGWNVLNASWRAGQQVLTGFGPLLGTDAQERRLALCTLCESRRDLKCAECGCEISKKTSYGTEFCPLGFWNQEQGA